MTKLENCLDDFQIFVSTYKKYNEGNLFGRWLKLIDYSNYDELKKAMLELHSDEDEPEFMLSDYECSSFFINQNLICEGYLSREIYHLADKINEFDYGFEVIEAFSDCFGQYSDIDELFEKVSESYYGEYDSDIHFAENLLEETGDIPKNLPSYIYIDWERTARDLMFDFSSSNGYYFRSL
ncbi:antirestriction protein ArdA [uncultured Chryseobacterium sp.]|uniref:antirestriction protein ArdA n=1 Tax=uncultured Chryseobacterium sp. TaxID=259322 RepID=UPI002629714E|nr:antirestriction protein ArdA [uncultured Chryseobacterium sp.]